MQKVLPTLSQSDDMARPRAQYPSTHPQFYTRQMRTGIRALGDDWTLRMSRLNLRDGERDWNLTRTYKEYEDIFRPVLQDFVGAKSFEEYLKQRKKENQARGENGAVNVREDGAGDGEFLLTLSERGRINKVRVRTTAGSLNPSQALCEKYVDGKIGRIEAGPAELSPFKPKTDDTLISLWGAIHYTPNELRRQLFLKHLYSLKEGAIALIGVDHRNPRNSWSIRGNLMHDHYGKVTAEQERTRIVADLKKMGFKAKFYKFKRKKTGFPNLVIAVRRTAA
jgi:hypothetical protein